ncbi:MAG: glutamine synthetase, partial [Armatimonadetes bacterium]|nr:glutamine synthetase [Armatimonadota bacterium]
MSLHTIPGATWLSSDRIDTVIVAVPDMYGRLMGKRFALPHFLEHVQAHGTHVCSYLLTVDVAMNPLDGFKVASWDAGYGDLRIAVDLGTLRPLPWLEKTALALGQLHQADGALVAEAPRSVLSRQNERLAERGWEARMGSELEFYLFGDAYPELHAAGYRMPLRTSEYLIDYHILQPGRHEDVLRRIRNEMSAARVEVECSKGEWGLGQHEVNLACAEAMEMADRHVVYKAGAKEIASQQGKSLTFMAKWAADEAGSSCHIHSSLWSRLGTALFWDDTAGGPSLIFRQFLGGLLKYSRELTYFFAPTVNSYKRYESLSWAPTAVVWAHDNRTCGFRVVGHGDALRVENRMPGGDANPYLAFAATIAAGLAGVEERLDCGEPFVGNAYEDASLPRLPGRLEEAADLLEGSALARQAFGGRVVDYYVRTARVEAECYRRAVTDWERER